MVKSDSIDTTAPAALLMKLRGIGPEFAAVLWLEGLFRNFANRHGLRRPTWGSGVTISQGGCLHPLFICMTGTPANRPFPLGIS